MIPIDQMNNKEKKDFLENIIKSDDRFFNDFSEEFQILINDLDIEVRELTISALWDFPSTEFLSLLLDLSEKDPEQLIRERAISGLGRYMFELEDLLTDVEDIFSEYNNDEEIPKYKLIEAKNHLISIYRNPEKPIEERCYAIKALGFLTSEEIQNLIEEAYNSTQKQIKLSAIYAIGRNSSLNWKNVILKEIKNPDVEIKIEAIGAAGEIGIIESYKELLNLTYSQDKNLATAAIMALAKTGWKDAFQRLDELSMSSDSRIREVSERAMENWYIASENYGYNSNDF